MAEIVRIEITGTKDKDGLQLVSGRTQAGEVFTDALRVQGHGLSTHAPAGSIGIVAFAYGRRDMPMLIGLEHPDGRPKGQDEGGATLYDHRGNKLTLLGDGGAHLDSGDRDTKITAKVASVAGKTRTNLGGDGTGGGYARVMTESGPSATVFAKV